MPATTPWVICTACYNHFRYYDPATGRYTSSDPIGLGGGPNNQAYVANPLRRVDILGLAGDEDCAVAALNKLDEDQRDKILYRTNLTDKKGRGFGSPGNPDPPSIETFNPRFEDIRAGDLQSQISSRMHGLFDDQVASVSQLSNEDLVRWRPEDPISATRGSDGLALTGGHHRTADIIQRVASGTLSPDTIVRILTRAQTGSMRNNAIRSAAAANPSADASDARPVVTNRRTALAGCVAASSRSNGRRSSTGTSTNRAVVARLPRVRRTVSAARTLATHAAFGNAWTR